MDKTIDLIAAAARRAADRPSVAPSLSNLLYVFAEELERAKVALTSPADLVLDMEREAALAATDDLIARLRVAHALGWAAGLEEAARITDEQAKRTLTRLDPETAIELAARFRVRAKESSK